MNNLSYKVITVYLWDSQLDTVIRSIRYYHFDRPQFEPKN